MSVFADSSALVKLYADEAGAGEVRALRAVAVSQLSRVEVPAALWAKQRLVELDVVDAQVLTAEFAPKAELSVVGNSTSPYRQVSARS